jgi:hypothetical protein
MKLSDHHRVVLFILTLLWLCTQSASAQSEFEGVIESRNVTLDERGKPQEFTITMYVRQNMVRIQTSAAGTTPATVMIYRGDKKMVWMVNDEEKSYFEIAQDQQTEQIYSPSGNSARPVVKRTGKKKKILGYECEEIRVNANGADTEIWGTKALGNVYKTISQVLGGEAGGLGDTWEEKVTGMGFYPLSSVTRMEGKVYESQEVTRVDKKTISTTLFDLPAGYKKEVNGGMIDGGQ